LSSAGAECGQAKRRSIDLTASVISAINGVIFQWLAVDRGFLVSLLWGFVGQVMAGLALLVFVPSYRRDFLGLFKQLKAAGFGLMALSKILFSVAPGTRRAGSSGELVPARFRLCIRYRADIVFSRAAQESLGRMKMVQKGVGIGLMLVGGYLISR
jgi:hypothetical protein